MLYRHVFDKIITEFHGISRIYLNFAALRPREISEALSRRLPDNPGELAYKWAIYIVPILLTFHLVKHTVYCPSPISTHCLKTMFPVQFDRILNN